MIPGFSAHGLGIVLPAPEIALPAIAAAGFRSVDLRFRDLYETGIPARSIRSLLENHGLRPGVCSFPLDWRDPAIDVREILENLSPIVDYAVETGIGRLYTRVAESVPEGISADEILADHRKKLHAISARLADVGIRLAIETVGVESFRKGQPPLMPTLRQVRELLADCFAACPNLGLLVDAFHLHAAGEPVEVAVGPLIDRVFGLHVADLPKPLASRSDILDHERSLPGTTGQVPVRKILMDLRRLGCPDGTPVIVESLVCPEHLRDEPFETVTKAVYESLERCLSPIA